VKNTIVLSSTLLLLILSALPLTATAQGAPPPSLPKGVTTLCSNTTHKELTGIYNAKGGAFVEDYFGDIVWCAGGSTSPPIIAQPPQINLPGDLNPGFYGMAGVSTPEFGTVLVLSNNGSKGFPPIFNGWSPGFYMCIGATSTGCFAQTGYFGFPSSYCSGLTYGVCEPRGIAIDSKLNVYFVDALNAVVAKCTYASRYQSCSTIETLSDKPTSIFLDSKGNIWVTDMGCSGYVWLNGVQQYQFFDSMGAVTISSANPTKTPHLYLTIDGGCGTYGYTFIYDVTDHTQLPSPFSPSTNAVIYGLSTGLHFPVFNSTSTVYTVKDST
jgi:hypothetical protein